MRVSQLSIAASLLSLARAAPGWQLPGSVEEVAVEAFDSAQSWVQHALQGGQDKLDDFREKFQIGVQSSFVNVHGIECEPPFSLLFMAECSCRTTRPLCRTPRLSPSPTEGRRAPCL